jgi:hypothetical protein
MMRVMGLVGLLLALGASPASAQLRGFINSAAGIAVPIGDDLPDTGGGAGFAVQGEVGLWVSRIGLAAEVAQHNTGGDRKVKVFGGVLRIPSWTQGPVRPYLATGLGAYRYSIEGVGSRTSVGGSVGPGALFRLRGTPAAIMLEARFHATFDRQPGVNTQQFFAIMAGAELSL